MKLSLTRDEVADIVREHFAYKYDVQEVKVTPHGQHVVEVDVRQVNYKAATIAPPTAMPSTDIAVAYSAAVDYTESEGGHTE